MKLNQPPRRVGSRAEAHGRERLQVPRVQQGLPPEGRAEAAREDPLGPEALRVRPLRQVLRQGGLRPDPHEDPQHKQRGRGRRRPVGAQHWGGGSRGCRLVTFCAELGTFGIFKVFQ